jgi:hypothetical protein
MREIALVLLQFVTVYVYPYKQEGNIQAGHKRWVRQEFTAPLGLKRRITVSEMSYKPSVVKFPSYKLNLVCSMLGLRLSQR